MFGPVVAEHPLDLLHPGDEEHIPQEDGHFQHTLQDDPGPAAQLDKVADAGRHQSGQDGKEQDGPEAPHDSRAGQQGFFGLFAQVLPHPLFKGGLLFFGVVVLPHADLGRVHHVPVAHDQALDHRDGPPHNGDLHPAFAGGDGVEPCLDAAVGAADRTADLPGAAHHDPLHQGLPAHTGLETFFLCLMVHWSIYSCLLPRSMFTLSQLRWPPQTCFARQPPRTRGGLRCRDFEKVT